MTISTYTLLQRRIDEANKKNDPGLVLAATMAMNGYLIAELDRAEQDRATLMDMIRAYRLQIETLEDQA